MNANILQTAKAPLLESFSKPVRKGRGAVIIIDGVQWTSEVPENTGEAQTHNEDAERIVERLK